MGPSPQPRVVADETFGVIRDVRAGRMALATHIVRDIPSLASALCNDSVNVETLFGILQTYFASKIARECASLERSDVSKIHKTAKRRRLRLRMEAYRPSRKFMSLDARYSHDGDILADAQNIGNSIKAAWEPAFATKACPEDDM